MVQRMERDAEVDALQARLAAAEARAERAVGLLGDARKCVSLVNVNGHTKHLNHQVGTQERLRRVDCPTRGHQITHNDT